MGRILLEANQVPEPKGFENPANGTHLFEVAPDGFTETDINGKLVFKVRFNIVESFNADDVGKTINPTFWIGSDEDPEAADPATLLASDGYKAFSSLLRATGLGNLKDTDSIAAQLPGTRALGNTWNDKRGYTQVRQFFAQGEQMMAAGYPKVVRGGTHATNGTGKPLAGATPGTVTAKATPDTVRFGRVVE